MTDILGPLLLIVLIYALYYGAQNLDTIGATKKSKLDLDKITAETKKAELDVRKRELDLQMGKLAIEARKLDQIEHIPPNSTEAEYTIVEKTEPSNKK